MRNFTLHKGINASTVVMYSFLLFILSFHFHRINYSDLATVISLPPTEMNLNLLPDCSLIHYAQILIPFQEDSESTLSHYGNIEIGSFYNSVFIPDSNVTQLFSRPPPILL
ncbi:MAG: hypothetical protein KJ799_06650 [Bacteroidetes bacterium]|nr:hypothetical protein [Bacteroidota bacterium]MBU1677803.1 hypothetical protein [Bacteroidota bacterium]MBU2506387.1 hypothetical protein [Bacteroidota bacterium]